jgi:hypothetical protein
LKCIYIQRRNVYTNIRCIIKLKINQPSQISSISQPTRPNRESKCFKIRREDLKHIEEEVGGEGAVLTTTNPIKAGNGRGLKLFELIFEFKIFFSDWFCIEIHNNYYIKLEKERMNLNIKLMAEGDFELKKWFKTFEPPPFSLKLWSCFITILFSTRHILMEGVSFRK